MRSQSSKGEMDSLRAVVQGEEYKLFWPDQPEFVRMASRFGAAIIPFGVVGEDDICDVSAILLRTSGPLCYFLSLKLQCVFHFLDKTLTNNCSILISHICNTIIIICRCF